MVDMQFSEDLTRGSLPSSMLLCDLDDCWRDVMQSCTQAHSASLGFYPCAPLLLSLLLPAPFCSTSVSAHAETSSSGLGGP